MEIEDDFTVNWDGVIYKCPGFIGRGDLAAGDVRGGLREYRRANGVGAWRRRACLECAYLPLCFGGCRYMKLLREGTVTGVDCQREYLDAVLGPMVRQDSRYLLKNQGHS